jgi:hypothetical protein
MSFWIFGPTELRVLLAIANLALLRWPSRSHHPGVFDIGGLVGIAGMAVMLLFSTAKNIVRLYNEERFQ